MGLFDDTRPDFEVDEIPTVAKALTFYRVMAWVVGIFLVVLVCIGMPLKYLGGQSAVVTYVGIAHGWLYPVLLIAAYNLSRKVQWSFKPLLAIALAGTVPFLSFVAEHFATKNVLARIRQVQDAAR